MKRKKCLGDTLFEIEIDKGITEDAQTENLSRSKTLKSRIMFLFTLFSFFFTTGRAEVAECPAGYSCFKGETTACEEGWYSLKGDTECYRCPPGKLNF